jgi:hypothetical protein
MPDRRGFSIVSLVISLGIGVAGMALAARCLIVSGRVIAGTEHASGSLLERFRAGEFAASLLSWSGCGEPGTPPFISRNAAAISFRTRPCIDGPESTVSLAISGNNLVVQRDGGRRLTVTTLRPHSAFGVGEDAVVVIPLGDGLDAILTATPAIDRPIPWGEP